jgi:phage tail sheath protein FI
MHRPEVTAGTGTVAAAGYVEQVQQGSDGHELSDYDVIGSRRNETGLFALQQIDRFDLLYIPPPGKGRDLGPASLLAAELYCRERGAMLIVDPATDWVTPAKAVAGIRNLGIASPNALAYFPRMYHRSDRSGAPRAVGGAIAGLLCRHDRTRGPWQGFDGGGPGLSRDYLPAFDAAGEDLQVLTREGLNVLVKGPGGRAGLAGSVTLGRGAEAHRRFASLRVRRLYLRLVNAIAAGTRWSVFEPIDERLADRIRAQVTAYLAALANLGAFEADRFAVGCDAGVSRRDDEPQRGVTILVSFRPACCSETVSFALHQAVSGCRVASSAFAPVFDNCA